MTTAEARYVFEHRDMYSADAVAYAMRILEQAGEL